MNKCGKKKPGRPESKKRDVGALYAEEAAGNYGLSGGWTVTRGLLHC